jgi:hypothetical protein
LKRSGLGMRCFVDGRNLSGDVGALNRIAGGPAALDVTGIDKEGYERIGGLRDGGIDWTGWFNDAADQAHLTLSTLPTADRVVSVLVGTTLGDPGASVVAKQINYDFTRGQDGQLTTTVQATANGYGLEWGRQMTAGIRTESAATNGSSVDFGTGSTAFGLQAYIHVFALTSGSPTVKLQESSDDGAGDAFADVTGGSFGVVAAQTSARIATSASQTIERYLRVVTTGTFAGLQFAVIVTRNDTATVF